MSIVLLASIICTTIVYSAFNTELQIDGDAVVIPLYDVKVTNLILISSSNGAYETYSSMYDKRTTSMYVTLPSNASIIYEVKITNNKDVWYIVESIINESNINPNVDINIELKENDLLPKESVKSFYITFANNSENEQKCDLVLKYKFSENKRTVSFNYNGGSSGISSKEVYYGNAYGNLPVPVREGYNFDGWVLNYVDIVELIDNTTINGGTGLLSTSSYYIASDFIPITGGITLTSNMAICGVYTYDSDCTFIRRESGYTTTHKLSDNAAYIRIEIRKDASNVEYYKSNLILYEEIYEDSVVNVNQNHVLTAMWSFSDNLMYFNPNGGVVNLSYKKIYMDQSYGELPIPTRDGYSFDGWYINIIKAINLIDNFELLSGQLSPKDSYLVSELVPIGNINVMYSNLAIGGIYIYSQNETFIQRISSYSKQHTSSSGSAWYFRIETPKNGNTISYFENNLILTDNADAMDSLYINEKIVSSTINKISGDVTVYAKWIKN